MRGNRVSCFITLLRQKAAPINRMARLFLAVLIVTELVFLSGCTGWTHKREQALKMVGSSPEEVKERIGRPNVVSKTPENSIFWVYRPSYKLMPNHKDSVYLEFQDGRVVKAFSLK